MKMTEHHTGELQISKGSASVVYLSHTEQAELLETLARIHGLTLIDREERKELQSLVTEVDEAPGYCDGPRDAMVAWRKRAEALASAVNDALRVENPKEV